MIEPLQITYRRLAPSNRIETCVRNRLDVLKNLYDGIVSCEVLIEAGSSPDPEQAGIHIHLDIGLPGKALWVDRELAQGETPVNIVPELHSAFASMEQQLREYLSQNRPGPQDLPSFGTVTELAAGLHYGIITASDGTEVYFHGDSVLDNAFGRVHPGSKVAFDAEPDPYGLKAVEVRLVDH
ncbi:MAG: HPF/RaiA family ribosome-associated protein [Gammaproteobacteria bacterium]|jgi:cold shock CspA family protein